MPTFDGANLLVTLDAGTPTVDVQIDLYSDWKEYFKTGDNSKFFQAFSLSAGGIDTVPGEVSGRNFFFRNDLGWRIRPAEEDAEIDVVGNLFKADATLPMFIPTLGDFTVLIALQRSSLALVEQTGISGLTAPESAKLTLMEQILRNRLITDPATGILTLYNDAGVPLLTADVFKDAAGLQAYDGTTGINRRNRLT